MNRRYFSLVIICVLLTGATKEIYSAFADPYAVNNWSWPLSICQDFIPAHFKTWRVMVSWEKYERYGDGQYDWSRFDGEFSEVIDNASVLGVKLSLCVYDSPYWSRSVWSKNLSYSPQKYARFITEFLKRCEGRHPGVIKAVEVENEYPTNAWDASTNLSGTDQRDPSWYYAAILKEAYNAVKSFNSSYGTNILVVMDGIWAAGYHHLDELYQLGCKGYFDRINFHYYLHEDNMNDSGRPDDPADTSTIWHFTTQLKYLKYLAEDNEDSGNLIWLTEFGWRIPDETAQANYTQYILDTCRKSGYVDCTTLYLGSDVNDMMAAMDESPYRKKPLYDMYNNYGDQYTEWDPANKEELPALSPASTDVFVMNRGFETGDTTGWNGAVIDNSVKHSGSYSGKFNAPNFIETQFYSVEPGKLYEVIGWVRIEAAERDTCMMNINYTLRNNGTAAVWTGPSNYYGVVDTRNYPGGWRKIRYPVLINQDKNEISIQFGSTGAGILYVDDLQIKALDFSTGTYSGVCPAIIVDAVELNFGELVVNMKKSITFNIRNAGDPGTTLNGTITSDQPWIIIEPPSFNDNNISVKVIADNTILKQSKGTQNGTVFIQSNGGNEYINVKLTTTCVLVKPNPVRLSHVIPASEPEPLVTFFGDGIVPGKTTIKVFTLSGELIEIIASPSNESSYNEGKGGSQGDITWNPGNLSPGIYLFTYESPAEKGIGKFTVVR